MVLALIQAHLNHMNALKTGIGILSILISSRVAEAQGFINLDFESANLTPTPAGEYGGEVSAADALPGWQAFLGTEQISQILQNNFTLGNASVDILGPDWSGGGIIEGQYTIVLQPGVDPFGSGQTVSASIAQTGLVPADAQSLEFKAVANSPFSVSLDGTSLPLIVLGEGDDYTLYGADISDFSGQTETLAITALAAPNTTDCFDSFVFSPSSVPEPNVISLAALGGLVLVWRCWRKLPRNQLPFRHQGDLVAEYAKVRSQ
jgi:hypothetical protein